MGLSPRAGSRFLAQGVKKGDRCDPVANNVCSGVQAKDGTQLLYCCKNHCRNVLSDRNNCGACGVRCGFGQLCCKGKCTAVAYDVDNCGNCGTVCQPGLRCEYGSCGYA
ncbi:Stigma-specific protein, Stig1 [Musa troglodytarum]|uniref:Stigma-specific protein, Stig1 n=1 Tax=Musa troglodytarum TaxID=320322 RepID=A0A9E7HIT7_9LILI|nr:Stigma-specific protein, Stig1 [Musa troglodytarum]